MYISYYFKKEAYIKTYEPMIYHVSSIELRVKINFEPREPLTIKKQLKRAKKSWKRGPKEP